MNLGQIITMLKLFPQDTPVLNAPIMPFNHAGSQKGIALKMGATYYEQNPTESLFVVLERFEMVLLHGTEQYHMPVNEDTDIFLTEKIHQSGTKVKGILFQPKGITFLQESYF